MVCKMSRKLANRLHSESGYKCFLLGLEIFTYVEILKVLSLFSLEKKGLRGPHHSIPVPKAWLQRGWKLSLHKKSHGEDKGQ